MGGLLVSKEIEVQSYRGKYKVVFCELDFKKFSNIDETSFLVIDSKVDKLYPNIKENFQDNLVFVVDAIEANKTVDKCLELLNRLVSSKFKRNHNIVAVGGGIIQDIVGFTSSVLYRGVNWTFVPTTLLSQTDSCIGSKTSINFGDTKNLLGTFHPPKIIYCCYEFLNTLEESEIKSGIGEMLHYFLVDGSQMAFDINEEYDALFSDRSQLEKYIHESLTIKKRMVIKEEFDQGERRVFNYGHTFGHAIEAITEHKVPHGQAVTIGMDIANYVSYKIGNLTEGEYANMSYFLKKNMPDFRLEEGMIDSYMGLLKKDKKNISNSITCILPYAFGDIRVEHIHEIQFLKKTIIDYINSNTERA
jgi:3-dehydroquinate synthase